MQLATHDRFFLTRQSANIMQDLLRQLKQAGSISLLYGVRGIGKSRLLKQFAQHQLVAENSLFVQFNSSHCFVFVLRDDEEFAADEFSSQVLACLNNKSTLLIDQFDLAPAEIQQSILKYWSHEAFEKGFRMVITVQSNSLQQLIESSKYFHLQIDSVELKPLNYEEQLDYLRSCCCPELRSVAVVPPRLKKILKLTNGLFSQLETFRVQHSDEINCREDSPGSRVKLNKILLAGFSGLLILVLSVIIFQNLKLNTGLIQEQPPIVQKNSTNENKLQLNPEPLTGLEEIAASIVMEKQPADADSNIISDEKLNESGSTDQHQKVDDEPIATMSKIDVDVPQEVVIDSRQDHSFFYQRLQATKLWLGSAEKKSASIQIMTITIDKNPQQPLNRYLKKLKTKLIDLEKIKIFPIVKNNRQMYGVLYGEFSSLNMAYQEIKRLPDILKSDQPYPRTVKGINEEVNWF